jgi:nitronate monooxygenase
VTRVRDFLRTDLPIIQAPMAGVQGSALAIAVANAGGLGSLPCAMLSAEAMHAELTAITAATGNPFNVNFFCHTPPVPDPPREAAWRDLLSPYYREFGIDITAVPAEPGRTAFSHEHIDVLSQFKPPVVSFHFGLPSSELLERVREWRPAILSSATTVEEAQWLEDRGVDAVIAQGLEAGGHRGMFLSDDLTTQVGTLALVHQIVHAVRIPVIAAGGIADATGVAGAIALGATAVQIGTAYLLCPETTTSPLHRAALSGAARRHTALTNVFTGRPARSIVNRIVREIGPMSALAPQFPMAISAMLPLRQAAEAQGSSDFSPLWSGQNASGCSDVAAAALTAELARGLSR